MILKKYYNTTEFDNQNNNNIFYCDETNNNNKTPIICHWKMKGQEAIDKLLHESKLSSSSSTQKKMISIFVCDMNDEMENPVKLLKQLCDNLLLAHPCLVVLTFKNTCQSKKEFEQRKFIQIQKLERDIGVSNIQEIHLFANTKLETTVVGEVLSYSRTNS